MNDPSSRALWWLRGLHYSDTIMGIVRENIAELKLEYGYRHELNLLDENPLDFCKRFIVETLICDPLHLRIEDHTRKIVSFIPCELFENSVFNILHWYEFRLAQFELEQFDFIDTDEAKKSIRRSRL